MRFAFSTRRHHDQSEVLTELAARLGAFGLRLVPILAGMMLVAAATLFASSVSAERIKDLGHFQGLRSNQLTGYGIVVGLAGTGDDNLEYTTQGMHSVA